MRPTEPSPDEPAGERGPDDWRRLEAELRRSELVARVSLDALEQGVILARPGAAIDRMNPAAQRILGYTAEDLLAEWRRGWRAWDEDGRELPAHERPIARAVLTGRPVLGEIVTAECKDGHRVQLRLSVMPDADGAGGMVITFTDVTDERRLMRRLARYGHLFAHASELVVVLDADGRLVEATPSRERLVSPDAPDNLLGRAFGVVHPADAVTAGEYLANLWSRPGPHERLVVRVRSRTDAWCWLECIGVNLLDTPAVAGVVITARDVTEREELTRLLAHRAAHDELTGLVNRSVAMDRLGEGLARAGEAGRSVAVCFVDLDRFKDVNDTLGHAAGDELLVEVAEVLRRAVRPGDTAARLGGDEFLLLLDGVAERAEADRVAGRVAEAVEALGVALPAATGFGVSIGVALSRPGDTAEELVARADRDLYAAKVAGRGRGAPSEPA